MIENEFYIKMKNYLHGNEYNDFCESLTFSSKRGLVFNNLKMNKDVFLKNFNYELLPLDYTNDGYILNTHDKMGGNVFHHAGVIYMQEPSAMIAGIYLPLKDGDIVLDACASPGGKTFQIAKRLNGTLVSNEFDFDRAKVLNANIERLGLANVMVTNFTPKEIGELYVNKFDCVLVDAPCSGEGMFRKEEQAIERWSQEYVKVCASRQKDILLCYDKALKNSGYLMYSTCTYSIEENEEIVAFLVNLGYKVIDIGKITGESEGLKIKGYNTELCKRFYPHRCYGEGQFVCLLQKCKDADTLPIHVRDRRSIGATELRILTQFFKDNLSNVFFETIKNNLILKKDTFYYIKDKTLLLDDKKVVNYGVKLGSVVKGRFEPDHNFFTAFSNNFKRKVDLTEKMAYDYLKGNAFEVDADNGWCVVTFLNASLGGGKVVNGLLKNHYPKGLRLVNTKK